MCRSMMRNFKFVNLFVAFLLVGCISVKPPDLSRVAGSPHVNTVVGANTDAINPAPTSAPFLSFDKGLYKATMNIKNRELSGLLLIKRMDSVVDEPGMRAVSERTYRVVFANEIGLTFFDLEVSANSYRVIQCFESLNRKALQNILMNDLRVLLDLYAARPSQIYLQTRTGHQVVMIKEGNLQLWQTRNHAGDTLLSLSGKSNVANPVHIDFREYQSGAPKKIILENRFIGLRLTMRKISD